MRNKGKEFLCMNNLKFGPRALQIVKSKYRVKGSQLK